MTYSGKQCSKCQSTTRYIKTKACVNCVRTRASNWSKENKERRANTNHNWWVKNADRCSLKMKQQRIDHPEERKAYIKNWNFENKDKKQSYFYKAKYGISLEEYK